MFLIGGSCGTNQKLGWDPQFEKLSANVFKENGLVPGLLLFMVMDFKALCFGGNNEAQSL